MNNTKSLNEITNYNGFKFMGGFRDLWCKSGQNIKNKEIDVNFLCFNGSPIHEFCRKNKIQTLEYPENKLYAIFKLTKYFKNNYDIIHTRITKDLWTIVPALKLSKSLSRLYLTINMDSSIDKKDIFHRWLYKKVDKVFTVSNYIKRNVINRYPFSENDVIVLHDGADLSVFDKKKYNRNEIRKELKINKDDIVIGHCGRISYGKGHKEIAEAAAIIDKKYPSKIKYLIVGDAAENEKECKIEFLNKLNDYNLRDKFILTGFRNDVAKYMAIMDILAFPSHLESFGDTLVEAMSMEIPVIASNNGGITDIVIDNETGILIPPGNHKELAIGLMKLIEDKNLRDYLAKNGRKRAEDKFDLDKIVNTLIKYYGEKQN